MPCALLVRRHRSKVIATKADDRVGKLLRRAYGDVLREPIPGRLLSLLKPTETKENDP